MNSTSVHPTGQAKEKWRPSIFSEEIQDSSVEIVSDHSSDIIEVRLKFMCSFFKAFLLACYVQVCDCQTLWARLELFLEISNFADASHNLFYNAPEFSCFSFGHFFALSLLRYENL